MSSESNWSTDGASSPAMKTLLKAVQASGVAMDVLSFVVFDHAPDTDDPLDYIDSITVDAREAAGLIEAIESAGGAAVSKGALGFTILSRDGDTHPVHVSGLDAYKVLAAAVTALVDVTAETDGLKAWGYESFEQLDWAYRDHQGPWRHLRNAADSRLRSMLGRCAPGELPTVPTYADTAARLMDANLQGSSGVPSPHYAVQLALENARLIETALALHASETHAIRAAQVAVKLNAGRTPSARRRPGAETDRTTDRA